MTKKLVVVVMAAFSSISVASLSFAEEPKPAAAPAATGAPVLPNVGQEIKGEMKAIKKKAKQVSEEATTAVTPPVVPNVGQEIKGAVKAIKKKAKQVSEEATTAVTPPVVAPAPVPAPAPVKK